MRNGRGLRNVIFMLCAALVAWSCSGEAPDKNLKIGDSAPGFSGTDLEGNEVSLSDYAGKPMVIRFWSTECKYCRADTPVFLKYYQKYRENRLGVLYININSPREDVERFVEELNISFPVILDDRTIADKFNIHLVPQTIVLDTEHTIIAAILGGISQRDLQELLSPYLHE